MADYLHNDNTSCDFSGMTPDTCAVLVIDELGAVRGGALEGLLLDPTLNTDKIIRAARSASVPVIFANDAHIPGIDRELELWGEHGIAGSEAAAISPELTHEDSDFVIEKRRYSAFFQTGMLLLLQELGVKSLILCGFDTNICVQHTAADAYFNNFDIAVVSDATATFLVGNQENGLNYMKTCYAARIVDTSEVLDFLHS